MKPFKITIFFTICLLSIGLSGCFKWAARAVDKLPQETALQKKYEYDGRVVIIGAGASGLSAAKVLEENNVDYIVLEATDRYGGRLKKDTVLADFPIDAGAEWIHSNPRVLNVIKGKPVSQIDEELIAYKLDSSSTWNGKKLKPVSKSFMKMYYNFMPESKFKNSTWYDFVNDNIAKEVKDKIIFNSAVNAINYSGEKIIVTTSNGKKYYADKVLVTVSIGILKSNDIAFTPEMSSQKKKAIESITFHPGLKVALKFSEKFYPDAIRCKVKKGEKTFYDIAFKKDAKTNILGFLCTGDEAKKYTALNSNKSVVNQIIRELDAMFDGKATEHYMGEYLLENWGQHQFTKGTWTQAVFEKKSQLKILNQSLDNKVYFAGEINDTYKQMGVPGAVLSGYYAVDKLLTEQ